MNPRVGERDRALRALVWIPYVLLAVLVAAVVRWVSRPVTNTDTFFHLRFGHEFLNDWSLRDPGHVSSFGNRDWLPTQWSSEMLMALAESAFGLPGVAWLCGVVVLVTVTVGFLVARAYADPLPAVVVTVLMVLATTAFLSGRPQVISYLLVLLVTHTWLRTAQDLRPRWWLVPLTWVWATAHGMWPVGAVIGLVAVAGITLDHRATLGPTSREILRLAAVPVLSLVAAALTPLGPGLYGAVLLVGGRAKFHDEWAATDFHLREPALAGVLVVVTLLVWLRGRTQEGGPGWVQLLLLLLAGASSAWSLRTVPVAVMITVPLVAGALQGLIGPRRPAPRRERTIVLGTLAAGVALLAAVVPFSTGRTDVVPSWLDPALDRLPAGTVLQSTDTLGGYLMWRHPDLDLVIDAYSDAYTTEHLQEQLELQRLDAGWDRTLRESGARYVLLPDESRLGYALVSSLDWEVLHRSGGAQLLKAPTEWGR